MKKNRFWQVALPVCIALWTLTIWFQSLLSGAQSSAESGWVMRMLTALFGWETVPEWGMFLLRKVAHFAEFAVLGMLWSGHARLRERRLWWLWGLPTAVVDECLQFLSPGRAPMVGDVVVDTAGYLCGVAFILLVTHFYRKKKK